MHHMHPNYYQNHNYYLLDVTRQWVTSDKIFSNTEYYIVSNRFDHVSVHSDTVGNMLNVKE